MITIRRFIQSQITSSQGLHTCPNPMMIKQVSNDAQSIHGVIIINDFNNTRNSKSSKIRLEKTNQILNF